MPGGASCPSLALGDGGWEHRHDRGYYDWSSGWLMRARYNCQGDQREPPAASWVHLRNRTSNTTWDDLIQRRGGHMEIAAGAMRRTTTCRMGSNEPMLTNVLMLGDSMLRQVFEALASRFRAHITGGALNAASPTILRLTQKYEVDLTDFGFLRLPMDGLRHPGGCHGFNISAYYRHGPPADSLDICEDNLAWIEFNKTLRVTFVFRPSAFSEDLETVLSGSTGISLHDVDVLVCNDRCGGLGTKIRDRFLHYNPSPYTPQGHYIDFGPVRSILQAQLLRDSGSRYGATNGKRKDDSHACMPGLPDDEVDILFAAITTRSCSFVEQASARKPAVVKASARLRPARSSGNKKSG